MRRISGGKRSQQVRFGRFLSNGKVTIDHLIEGWGERTASAAAGRHVLAIQDTSEINFRTTPERQRGLGEIGKGVGRGVLMHAMLAVDAVNGGCLGLVAGRIWTRKGRIVIPHRKRRLEDKESERWIATGEDAKQVLASAAMVTVVGDREHDFYAAWATLPAPNFHLIIRLMHDRCLVDGTSVYAASTAFPHADSQQVDLPARAPNRPARTAVLSLRFGKVALRRPKDPSYRDLPQSVRLTLIEVIENECPDNAEPVHWHLLTTHDVADAVAAWQIVAWYKQRWIIEQLFRLMKTQGLQLEDSQIETAERLIKLAAVAAKAAAITLQLVQARDGRVKESAALSFSPQEIPVLEAVNTQIEGKTALQKNPYPKHALAWAAWIIARLGGWDGYPSSKPPGPITFRYGLEQFRIMCRGWGLRDVCMP